MRWRVTLFGHTGLYAEEFDGVATVGWQEFVVTLLDTDNNILHQFAAINVCKVEPLRMPEGFRDT